MMTIACLWMLAAAWFVEECYRAPVLDRDDNIK